MFRTSKRVCCKNVIACFRNSYKYVFRHFEKHSSKLQAFFFFVVWKMFEVWRKKKSKWTFQEKCSRILEVCAVFNITKNSIRNIEQQFSNLRCVWQQIEKMIETLKDAFRNVDFVFGISQTLNNFSKKKR